MIPNQWYAIAEPHEVKTGKLKAMRRMGQDLVLWRDQEGKLSCMLDLCPHRGAALSAGKIMGDCIECPFHGFQYDTEGNGKFIPANGRNTPVPKAFKAETFTVREAHDFIWLWYGEPQAEYPPISYFEELTDDSFIHGTVAVQWNSHYTRSIENQLDVSHLPFVHKNTIGRGNQTLVNGPYVTLEDNTISVWVDNQVDDGTPPTKPTKMPEPLTPPGLIFKFPNIWLLRIADNFQLSVAFAPIDDDNTMLYVRSNQRSTLPKFLAQPMINLSAQFNRVILREDQRVVVTQRPKISGLDIGERFIPGDRPIALYLIHRRELIQAAQAGENLATDGKAVVAQADAEIDWSIAEAGEITPSL